MYGMFKFYYFIYLYFLVTVFLIGCIEYPLLGWFTLLVIMPGIILVWRKGYVVRSVLKTKPEEKYRDKVLKQAKELDSFMFDAKRVWSMMCSGKLEFMMILIQI